MVITANDGPKRLLNGLLLGSVVVLTVLPVLGWTWHSVLPEHMHVFFGPIPANDDEILPAAPAPDNPALCLSCSGQQIGSGMAHIPALGMQVVAAVGIPGALIFRFVLPQFSQTVRVPSNFYRAPALARPEPPPERETSVLSSSLHLFARSFAANE